MCVGGGLTKIPGFIHLSTSGTIHCGTVLGTGLKMVKSPTAGRFYSTGDTKQNSAEGAGEAEPISEAGADKGGR